ncbi:FAD:protein FMN transferase [Methylobacter svalbardensis]|uniref:FAD:protein FMN transferase n=1 Tax=Methylobacter svalbardensis TaxID=3080016 RepID=UPI0030ED2B4E
MILLDYRQGNRLQRLILVAVCCLFLGVLTACSEPVVEKLEGPTQGTTYHISYWSEAAVDAKDIKDRIENELADIDKLLSDYRPDSTIEIFNNTENTDSQEVGAEIVALVKVAKTVHQAGQGCYDLTIKPLFDLWGFQGDAPTVPQDSAIVTKLKQVGMDKLEVVDATHLRKKQADLKVALSSISQGYSVERLSQVLEQKGIVHYLVEIGGELKTNGYKPDLQPWRIALERPLPEERVMHKVITMPKDAPVAVMTSGTYRHYFDDHGQHYSHVLDARNGRPVIHNLVSVTVLLDDPILADAWSTMLLCLGQKEGMLAANTAKIPALFIELQGDELTETRSDALNTLSNLAIH